MATTEDINLAIDTTDGGRWKMTATTADLAAHLVIREHKPRLPGLSTAGAQ